MEIPCFRSHWNYYPHRHPYAPCTMEIPIHRRTVPVAPDLVSIPVRFVESKKSRSDSATKIQKVFRGFLVRKNVKKVVAIEREVDEIEAWLANEETVESIRRDTKERVKFGEMLMNFLFRLDSVRGVDSGIRNLRKAVIKKAIAMQEKVDSIAATVNETLQASTTEFDSEAVDRSSEMNPSGARDGIPQHKNVSSDSDIPNICETADDCNEAENENGAIIEKSAPPSSKEQNIAPENSGSDDDFSETISEIKMAKEERVEEDRKERREVLERMMLENKRTMEMMGELFEKNEMQTRMLYSLSHRVEQLEKAFVLYETLRRKKKKNSTAIEDSSKNCPKTEKCDTIL